MTTVYIGERQSGKTTTLIEMSEKTGATIVVATYSMSKYIQMAAAQMGKKIPVPITVTNYIRLLASGGLGKSQKYLVDELQMMLEQMNVEAATVDSHYVEVLSDPQLVDKSGRFMGSSNSEMVFVGLTHHPSSFAMKKMPCFVR